MQALGFIETKGLLAAIEGADTMVKSADVSIIEKSHVGGGLVTICVTGDVGSVRAAVDAGVAAIKKLNEALLVSENIIPRPHDDINIIIKGQVTELEEQPTEITEAIVSETEVVEILESEEIEEVKEIEKTEKLADNIQKNLENPDLNIDELNKQGVDDLINTMGLDKTVEILNKLKLSKLRNLSREYKEFNIKGRAISKADKKTLINEFILYYNN